MISKRKVNFAKCVVACGHFVNLTIIIRYFRCANAFTRSHSVHSAAVTLRPRIVNHSVMKIRKKTKKCLRGVHLYKCKILLHKSVDWEKIRGVENPLIPTYTINTDRGTRCVAEKRFSYRFCEGTRYSELGSWT